MHKRSKILISQQRVRSAVRHLSPSWLRRGIWLSIPLLLLGCGSIQQWFEQIGDRNADVEIALQASTRLNLDTKGKPLSVVVRVFKLKDRAEFDRSSYETLTSDQQDKPGLAGDLLGTQELLLLPNSVQRYRESLDEDVQYIGLVAAFRKPSPTGWRLAFPVKDLVQRNVVVNLGPCFLTLTTVPAKTSQCADIRRKPVGKTITKPTKKNVQTT